MTKIKNYKDLSHSNKVKMEKFGIKGGTIYNCPYFFGGYKLPSEYTKFLDPKY